MLFTFKNGRSSFHFPMSDSTEIFANCKEFRKKYPQGVPAGHPAYQEEMDRGHDNYAYETN